MMYSPDKMMMNPKPLGPPAIGGTNCFSGRYSPTYRVPEQMRDPMRRCMTNPPVRIFYKLSSTRVYRRISQQQSTTYIKLIVRYVMLIIDKSTVAPNDSLFHFKE